MSPIKDFRITYEAVNADFIFSEGDTLTGTVTFTLTKDTKVKGVFVKAKGDARVSWSEGSGDDRRTYSAHRRYLKLKQCLVEENAKGTLLPQGVHHFKFSFTIPKGEMPSSFKGLHGKIVYLLEAKITRSWRLPTRVEAEINFVSKSSLYSGELMCSQHGSVNKEMGMFSKGQVQLSATINRKLCSPGDTLSVVAKIHNSSSKNMTTKFSLHQKIVYRASGHTNTNDTRLCKMLGDIITPNSEETVSCQFRIPVDVIYSLQNCDIVSVNYYLKVYLDISFSFDPEVVFPLVIIPSRFANLQHGAAVGPYPAGAVGGPSYSDFPPPASHLAPYHAPAGPGPYGYPAPDPTQHVNITSGYNNQWPQQATPYSFSTAPFLSSSAQPQAPSAPPHFPQTEPPPYTDLFPHTQYTPGSSGSDHKS